MFGFIDTDYWKNLFSSISASISSDDDDLASSVEQLDLDNSNISSDTSNSLITDPAYRDLPCNIYHTISDDTNPAMDTTSSFINNSSFNDCDINSLNNNLNDPCGINGIGGIGGIDSGIGGIDSGLGGGIDNGFGGGF